MSEQRMTEPRLIVPSPPGRDVRDVTGDGELLPPTGRILDAAHPHWRTLARIGWVEVRPMPEDVSRREAYRREKDAAKSAEIAAAKGA